MAKALGTRDIDLRGLKCPMPVLRTRRALATMPVGSKLDVCCTDPLSAIDLPNLLRETGDTMIESLFNGAEWRFIIQKTSPATAAR